MADSAAYEIFEVGVPRDKKGKSATRQFLEAWVDFTGGVLGAYVPLDYVSCNACNVCYETVILNCTATTDTSLIS